MHFIFQVVICQACPMNVDSEKRLRLSPDTTETLYVGIVTHPHLSYWVILYIIVVLYYP